MREVVSNTIRHSGAAKMTVRVTTRAGMVELEMRDDGRGLAAGASGRGNGLSNMEARLLALQGTLVLDTGGQGLAVRARFPLGAGERP
jgi:signal transduction histidine kinase